MAGENKKDPYSLREIFQQMELDLIASLKRNIFTHKDEELKEGFRWEQWQLSKFRNLIKYRNENKKIVGESSKDIQNTINEVLQESYQTGEENVEKAVNKISSQIKLPEGNVDLNNPPPKESNKPAGKPETVLEHHEENFFGMNEKKLNALQNSVNDDFKEAQQSILRQMDDIYRQAIYKTHVYLQSGAVSLGQAIDMATKDFLDRGINCIEYSNGRRVNISSYAEMALRTASQRATFLGEGIKRDEWGIHTIAVSAHANTCPLCLPWQGRVLIDDVYSHGSKADGDYPLLSEAMKAGLLHPQCRHTLATFFPGITKLPKPADEEEATKNYLAEQKQRLMERQIRKYKRIAAGSVDAENVEKANAKVREWQTKLRQHLKDNPELRRDYSREQIKNTPSINNNPDKYKGLNGTVTQDNITISSPTQHLIYRAVEREVASENIKDALQKPLKIGKIRTDKEGKKSKTYIGENATVAVNPESGAIITVYKTSSQRVRRLKRENKTE